MPLKKSFTARSTSPAFTDASSTGGFGVGEALDGALLLDGAGAEVVGVVGVVADARGVDPAVTGPAALEPPSDRGSKAQKAMSPASTRTTRAAATQRPRPRRRPRSGSCGRSGAGVGAAGGGTAGRGGSGAGVGAGAALAAAPAPAASAAAAEVAAAAAPAGKLAVRSRPG